MSRPPKRGNGEGSIYPYRAGYAGHVWVTTPDGHRRRKYVYGKSYDEVRRKWIELHARARAGPVATAVPRLGEYVSYWLTNIVKPTSAPLTYNKYEILARLYIAPRLGRKRLDRLSARDVQVMLNEVSGECQCCAQGKDAARPESKRRCCARGDCCRDYPSLATVAAIRGCLRSILSQAARDEYVAKNVAALTRLPTARRTRRSAWTTDEARRFLESAREDRDALYAAYALVLVLGLRKGEVLGLTWDAINFDRNEVVISRQIQRVGGQLLHRETKTDASDAPLPIPPICLRALKERRSTQLTAWTGSGQLWHEAGLVFTTRNGNPIEPRNLNRSWDTRCRKAHVRRITVHDARRTCATLLVDLDVHPRVIMQILRHAQVSVTMDVYAQVPSAATRDALRRLGDSLGV